MPDIYDALPSHVLVAAQFRKALRSSASGSCVEVAVNLVAGHGVVLTRDSKNPAGPVLAFSRGAWEAFTGGIRAGDLAH